MHNKIVQAARECIGTPYVHHGRRPGAALDCLGLVVHALGAEGFKVDDDLNYKQQPDGNRMMEKVLAHPVKIIPCYEIEPGDVLIFRYGNQPQHFGISAEETIIHAFAPAGAVVEQVFSDYWRGRLIMAVRPRGD